MSSDIVIKVSNLSKCFHIYNRAFDRVLQIFAGKRKQYYRKFWAISDVSFEIKKGETIGIIGCNGSGKSTLLQMICGTLNPTQGEIITHGRVAALLELGSGFNPEFTGRENVYMNASILGLSKAEIDNCFDQIVAFADIGEFIEQPVKTYSSGMMLRLAFAVIAHVNADILIIDEALAVGDAIFVQKCMRFLRKFKEQGTILFVSHDNGAILNFCDRAIWLKDGIIQQLGLVKNIIEQYIRFTHEKIYLTQTDTTLTQKSISNDESFKTLSDWNQVDASSDWKTGKAQINNVLLLDEDGNDIYSLQGGETVSIEIKTSILDSIVSPIIGWFVKDRLGQTLFGEHTYNYVTPPLSLKKNEQLLGRFTFQMPLLPNGDYSMTVSIAEGDPISHIQHHWINDALIFNITSNKLRYGLVGISFKEVSATVLC